MVKMKAGDTAYIVESNRIVREVKIISCSGGMYLVRFEGGGGIRVREHRLFATEEEAKKSITGLKDEFRKKTPYDYM